MKSFKRTTVVGLVVIVAVVAAAAFSGVQIWTAASEGDDLVVHDGSVEVGQVLDVATRDGGECVYDRGIELNVDVSLAEPSAGITVGLNDDCELTVIEKRRTFAK